MRFEFATAQRIIFGPGTLREVGPLCAALGRTALVVTGRSVHRSKTLVALLEEAGVRCVQFQVAQEPTVAMAEAAVAHARQADADCVVAIGGGSCLDVGKVVAAMLANPGELMDYLEVVGRGRTLGRKSRPLVTIPTTAGTGAEVTSNAVLEVPEHRRKVSLRSPLMLAAVALVDPDLTLSVPQAVTAQTGMDALTQLIEPFVSNKANPMTDGLCREGLCRAARSIRRAWEDGQDRAAREDMACASLFSGLALANAGLGAVHGLAGPIGSATHAPHGAICARLLPFVTEATLRALQARQPGCPALRRFAELGEWLTGRSTQPEHELVRWLHGVVSDLKIPSLGALGLARQDIEDLTRMAKDSSSMKGHPIELAEHELAGVLEQAL